MLYGVSLLGHDNNLLSVWDLQLGCGCDSASSAVRI